MLVELVGLMLLTEVVAEVVAQVPLELLLQIQV
jgi:hypothetical protein